MRINSIIDFDNRFNDRFNHSFRVNPVIQFQDPMVKFITNEFQLDRGIAPCGSDTLLRWAGLDATEAFSSAGHSATTLGLLESFCVGVLDTAPDSGADSNKEMADKAEVHFSWSCTSALERSASTYAIRSRLVRIDILLLRRID